RRHAIRRSDRARCGHPMNVLAQLIHLGTVALPASDGAPVFLLNDVLVAIGLLVLAGVLLLLEFLVVSYGLLAIAALGCSIAGIVLGFGSSPLIGWTLLGATPILAALVVAWGLRRLMRSDLVPKQEITEDAGYRHATEGMGVVIGTRGTLVTDAMPTGRARFPGGDLDVQIDGPAAMKGTVVTVRRIEGPSVIVFTDPGNAP
ncbi:MAG TPA: NfeD family protein, partial [Planctomycetota bacterium]|nr:NfeD family protein [Planctomycetota bacterium]